MIYHYTTYLKWLPKQLLNLPKNNSQNSKPKNKEKNKPKNANAEKRKKKGEKKKNDSHKYNDKNELRNKESESSSKNKKIESICSTESSKNKNPLKRGRIKSNGTISPMSITKVTILLVLNCRHSLTLLTKSRMMILRRR